MQAWHRALRSLGAALVAMVAGAIVLGRLAGVIAPIAASFATAACVVCHGCPVEHDHDVCDCEACGDVVAGKADGAASIHNPPHGSAANDAAAFDPGSGFETSLPILRAHGSSYLLAERVITLSSLRPRAPPESPPRS